MTSVFGLPGETPPPGRAQGAPDGHLHDAREPDGWQPPGAPEYGAAQNGPGPQAPLHYGPPQYGQPHYGQPQYELSPYGPPQYGPPQYGPPQYGPPQYGPPQYGPLQYGQPQYRPPIQGRPMWSSPVEKPTGWFIVNWLFFWPTAIYSLLSHWNNIDPAAYSGDFARARYHAAKVRTLGIVALCISGGTFVLYLVLIVVVFASIPPQ